MSEDEMAGKPYKDADGELVGPKPAPSPENDLLYLVAELIVEMVLEESE